MAPRRPSSIALVGCLLAVTALSACSTSDGASADSPSAPAATFLLTSPDIDADGYVPDSARGNVQEYCGDGQNISPRFEWTGTPAGTKSFTLLMTDPNDSSYQHWVVTGIPGGTTSLAAAKDGAVTAGVVGTNSRGPGDYVGPCQADNAYRYTLYALDADVEGSASTTVDQALALIDGHVLAQSYVEAKRH